MVDSLNWDRTMNNIVFDWSLTSFVFQPSFLSQYFHIDHPTKLSYLDVFLINNTVNSSTTDALYNAFNEDIVLYLNVYFLPMSPMFNSEYQESITNVIFLAPELSTVLNTYFKDYYFNSSFLTAPASVFDSFVNNLNFFFGEGMVYFFLFFLYIYFIIYFFTLIVSLK